MVVADLLVIDDLLCMDRNSTPKSKRYRCVHDQAGQACRHILGQIAAVGTGIGDELFLVERLGVVQGLLCRESQHPVGIPLQSSQVVEGGRTFGFLLALALLHNGLVAFLAFCQ